MKPFSQRTMERAVRAACKAGRAPTSAEIHPDGKIVLWFVQPKVSETDALGLELEQWSRSIANAQS